ncbi:MAG: lipoyl(octanoyl) transferase LipB [Gammaproteobacteria bacterium]|nr:lipoyl(octanoyl) transferase LipB [Gammaproteobacteria bacterium]
MAIEIRELGLTDYEPVWRAMQQFTDARNADTPDEIWFTEHKPVFTLGVNASREHLLAPGNIPVVQIDRGGQVTYHGPGQLMVYPLIDLRRAKIGVRSLVTALEQSVVDLAAEFSLQAESRADAPGVYVDGVKLASVGLRIRRGASFHGMALNVDVDLEPFSRINPCGYSELSVTDFRALGAEHDLELIQARLLPHFLRHLGFGEMALAETP